jgi:hypothetical protein
MDHGIALRASDSPRATATRLTEQLELADPAATALGRIAHAEERARYATTPASTNDLKTDVRTVRAAFSAAASRRTRWRARLAPPSTLANLRTSTTRTMEALHRLESSLPKLPRRRP